MTTNQKYKNLVLEGNGMAGLAYIGALKVLEERDIIKDIENFSGSSSGAIMTSLISIGYTSEEIYNLSANLDWKNMVKRRNCLFQFFYFWNKYGLYKYDQIEKTIKSFFLRKLGKSDLTFKEHYNITKKNLILVGVNVNKQKPEYFCNDLTPDMSVIKAIKISSSFPFIFDPVKHNNMLYIDGGIMNNFPIEYFGYENPETLGLNLIDIQDDPDEVVPINNVLNYGYNILHSLLLVQEHCDLEFGKKNVIYIQVPKSNINNTIILMNQNIDELYERGIKCTRKYFETQNQNEEDNKEN
jgi:predicted acylesterase/phospholipase RssA